ncbi:MAG: FxsA family protein [Planctomycetaceae bacterium]
MGRLVLVLVLIPLIELTLLIQLWQRAGLLMTLVVVFATGIIGVNLARYQGMAVWKAIHQQLAEGRTPSREILSGVMILLAGALLMTPGIVTDTCGFLLLVPKLRLTLGTFLIRWFRSRTAASVQMNVWPTVDVPGNVPEVDVPDEQPRVRVLDPEVSTGSARRSRA